MVDLEKAIEFIFRYLKEDGGWDAEDVKVYDVSATVEVIRVLKASVLYEDHPGGLVSVEDAGRPTVMFAIIDITNKRNLPPHETSDAQGNFR
jgi:hypothetical protein